MEREDATHLPLLDRYELVKTAIMMIDEGVNYHTAAIIHENPDIDLDELRRDMNRLRADSYINMLYTLVCDEDEAKQITRMLHLDNAGE